MIQMKSKLQINSEICFIVFFLLLLVSGCHKMEMPPLVTTTSATAIGVNSATCGGVISTEEGRSVTMRGVCWSLSENPTIEDSHTMDGSGLGVFTSSIAELSSLKTYYVRAYATNAYGTTYGEQQTFRTMDRVHEYVDLGLSVKWATCNVGASSPEGYGNYYAWGETTTKSEYTSNNSVTYGNSSIDSIAGNAQYDAARANWGGSWRLPTKAEIQELFDNCTHKWTTQNGVKGRLFTSKKNGNSIFLPAAGYRYGSSLDYAGERGYYWSATPYESYGYDAYYLFFYSGSADVRGWYRYLGRSVRPVSE